MTTPYNSQLTTLNQSIRTFAQQVRQEIDVSRVNATDYGVPYFTGSIVDGREMWGVVIDFGALPDNTTKAYLIPTAVTSAWSVPGERWIDTGNSFFYHPTTGDTYPIPFTSELDYSGGTVTNTQLSILLTSTEIIITTQSDRTTHHAVVVLKYLKAAV